MRVCLFAGAMPVIPSDARNPQPGSRETYVYCNVQRGVVVADGADHSPRCIWRGCTSRANQPGNSSRRFGMTGRRKDQSPWSGNEISRSGSEFLRSASEVSRSGSEFSRSGNDVFRSGSEFSRSRNEVSRSGNEFLRSANEVSRSANEFLRSSERGFSFRERVFTFRERGFSFREGVLAFRERVLGVKSSEFNRLTRQKPCQNYCLTIIPVLIRAG